MLEHDPAPFPEQDGLNIAALTGLFRNTTNSYKFVFFLALLELLKRHQFDPERPYPYTEITIEMLSAVWFAHTFFKLSFGAQDTITQKLDALGLDFTASESLSTREQSALRRAIANSDLKSALRLMDFVPYRLQIPFLEPQLRDIDKGAWMTFERAMPAIVNSHFQTVRPLYHYDSDNWKECTAIHWHPDWVRYLEQHQGIIHGWACWHWLAYMQRRNPNTPGLPNKLFPPSKRESVNKQSRYWREILNAAGDKPLTCIYTGEPLSPKHFALDHYLPWSFVVHDQLWNLIPAPPAVNASKSNHIPSGDHLRDLVDLQYDGLQIARRIFSPREFDRFTEDYIADLHLPSTETLLNYGELFNAYARTVEPLVTLATNQGFTSGWAYGSDDH
ncbi:hypothetical protein CKO42_08305 [Lamprobacter modestohalophilus]|uniref:HNH nuclease domain-containing protein n=1 Tax=Lamprobacter modestohalophilus TaxID=1064514 RepID=A0A9X1B4B5_9GAMM|nr:HNH endonuclease domain-containing protein [Lamprobacter modestohalophilus]MBK1618437.1 hypothetical protein [Lamprobacter modestohalophilus]